MAPRTTVGLVTGCELVRTGFSQASDEFRNIILMLEEAGLSFVLEHPCKIMDKEVLEFFATAKLRNDDSLIKSKVAGAKIKIWERRIGQAVMEEQQEVSPAVIPSEIPDALTAGIEGESLPTDAHIVSDISQIARDAVADIQEDSEAVPENEEALNRNDQGAEADVHGTADQELEEDADEDDFMDDEGEDDGNEGQEALETQDLIEPPSDKHAPEIIPENIGARVEGESEKSADAASIPPLEAVLLSNSTGASDEVQGQEVPPDLPLRDNLATHTVNIIQGIVNELKASFDKAQNKMLQRIKKSENLMLKNMVEINHKLDMMDKKFEEKYTVAGQAVTLLMAGLKKNTDTLAVVNQNAHVVANNIQKFDGNMVTLNANQQALALAKARGKRKAQEGTSKETQAEKRIRLSEEDVRNEKWSPVSKNIILDTFWLQEKGEINRNEVYSQYEWEMHKTYEAKRNIFFRTNMATDKAPPPRYYPKPKEYMERQRKKYLAQKLNTWKSQNLNSGQAFIDHQNGQLQLSYSATGGGSNCDYSWKQLRLD
ncbi:hypothetical protein KSP40_PGU000872 [Platanthera guangdongensis]|uniref:Uncharacterized protein n=1 Tax=Platanthera guangdongensis TaxID=2320717 RepID=A0ABR2N470_9ASPA